VNIGFFKIWQELILANHGKVTKNQPVDLEVVAPTDEKAKRKKTAKVPNERRTSTQKDIRSFFGNTRLTKKRKTNEKSSPNKDEELINIDSD